MLWNLHNFMSSQHGWLPWLFTWRQAGARYKCLHVICSLRIASRLVTKKSGGALIGQTAQEVRSALLFCGSLSAVPSAHHGRVSCLSLKSRYNVPLNHSFVTSFHYPYDETSQHCEENESSKSQHPQKYGEQPLILHVSHQLDLCAYKQGNTYICTY
jgi:hypothetical protein